jgi:hypothetical protein
MIFGQRLPDKGSGIVPKLADLVGNLAVENSKHSPSLGSISGLPPIQTLVASSIIGSRSELAPSAAIVSKVFIIDRRSRLTRSHGQLPLIAQRA